jgi:hypothetical protein
MVDIAEISSFAENEENCSRGERGHATTRSGGVGLVVGAWGPARIGRVCYNAGPSDGV